MTARPIDISNVIWVPDVEREICMRCEDPFWLFNRRHHCRTCGALVCGACSTRRLLTSLGDKRVKPRRVCNGCFIRLGQSPATFNRERLTLDPTDYSSIRPYSGSYSISPTSAASVASAVTPGRSSDPEDTACDNQSFGTPGSPKVADKLSFSEAVSNLKGEGSRPTSPTRKQGAGPLDESTASKLAEEVVEEVLKIEDLDARQERILRLMQQFEDVDKAQNALLAELFQCQQLQLDRLSGQTTTEL